MGNAANSQRIQKWDILKAILIFLVVLGHLVDYYTENNAFARSLYLFIYTFHMPLFIFISGIFSKSLVEQKRYDRVFGYFAVYVFDMLLRILLFHGKLNDLFSTTAASWYMLTMIFCSLATMFLQRFSSAYVLCFAVVFACFFGYHVADGDFLAVSRSIVFFPFYFLGYICDREKLQNFCNGKLKKFAAVILLAVLAVVAFVLIDQVYWLRPLLTAHTPYRVLGTVSSQYGFFIRLAYYLVAALAGLCVIILTPNTTKVPLVTKIGQRTLSIFVFQEILTYVYSRFIKDWLEGYFGDNAVYFVIPIAVVGIGILSLGVFDKFIKKIYTVPLRNHHTI